MGNHYIRNFPIFIDIIYWLFGDFSKIDSNFFKFNANEYVEFEDSGLIKFMLDKKIFGSLSIQQPYTIKILKVV